MPRFSNGQPARASRTSPNYRRARDSSVVLCCARFCVSVSNVSPPSVRGHRSPQRPRKRRALRPARSRRSRTAQGRCAAASPAAARPFDARRNLSRACQERPSGRFGGPVGATSRSGGILCSVHGVLTPGTRPNLLHLVQNHASRLRVGVQSTSFTPRPLRTLEPRQPGLCALSASRCTSN